MQWADLTAEPIFFVERGVVRGMAAKFKCGGCVDVGARIRRALRREGARMQCTVEANGAERWRTERAEIRLYRATLTVVLRSDQALVSKLLGADGCTARR
jgi:hypothetical protein